MDAETLVDLLEMLVHRRRGDPELGAHLRIRLAARNVANDLELSRRQSVETHVLLGEKQHEQSPDASRPHRKAVPVVLDDDG